MKKVNEVFFGEHGLTSTSANHLANIAQEKIVSNEAKLKNLNFVTTTVDIVGSPENSGKVINKGYDETRLSEVRGLLSEIADMNAFCAWIREAIKAKETELNDFFVFELVIANIHQELSVPCTFENHAPSFCNLCCHVHQPEAMHHVLRIVVLIEVRLIALGIAFLHPRLIFSILATMGGIAALVVGNKANGTVVFVFD